MFDHELLAKAILDSLKYKDTLRKISAEIGISLATLHRVMNGKKCQIDTVLKVCKWLDRPITDFIK